jgi:hypothetical protein
LDPRLWSSGAQIISDRVATQEVFALVEGPNHTYTYDLLIADAAGAMYAPEVWPEFADFLDQTADTALSDQPAVAALVTRGSRLLERLAPAQREADYPNSGDADYGTQSADTEYPRRFKTYLAIGRYAEHGSPFGEYWWWANAGCAHWPTAPDRYIGPWSARPQLRSWSWVTSTTRRLTTPARAPAPGCCGTAGC